jgi:hypothetical protein
MDNGSLLGPSTGHFVAAAASVWSTVNFGPGTALFTGVPLISNLKVTMANDAGVIQDGYTTPVNVLSGGDGGPLGPNMGGNLRVNGAAIIHAAGGAIQLPVPLSHVGGLMGETTMVTLIGNNITVTNGPFISDSIVITGVTSNVITIPSRPIASPPNPFGGVGTVGVAFTLQPDAGAAMTPSTNGGYVSTGAVGLAFENHTVTIAGSNHLVSGSQIGDVTVVSPMRIDTGPAIAGRIPGEVILHFEFVPEPGTMLLLVSGAVGLAVIGRRRMRK